MIFFCPVRSSRLFGLYHSVTAKRPRPLSSSDGRPAVVYRRAQLRVASRRLHMFILRSYGGDVPVVFRSFLLRGWTCLDPSVAVVAHAVYHGVVHHRRVIDVVDVGDVYIQHGTVIEEVSAVPAAARETRSKVAESVIDSAVEAYLRS